MTLRQICELQPGKLAVLYFEDEALTRCVGYVASTGVCEWPETAAGRRPLGWSDLAHLFADLPNAASGQVVQAH